jgi:hypothetical protein
VEDARQLRNGRFRRGRGSAKKDTVVTNAREHLTTDVGEFVSHGHRVVSGVEDEEGDLPILWKESDETADLFDGCG